MRILAGTDAHPASGTPDAPSSRTVKGGWAMFELTRRIMAILLILAAVTAGSLSLASLTAQVNHTPARSLAGGPFCCGGGQ